MQVDASNDALNNIANECLEKIERNETVSQEEKNALLLIDLFGAIDVSETPDTDIFVVLCDDVSQLESIKVQFREYASKYFGSDTHYKVLGNKVEFLSGIDMFFDLKKWRDKKSYLNDNVMFFEA